jgi:putative hydrolase of the HAD superfamily
VTPAPRAGPRWLLLDIDGVLLPAADLTARLRRDHGISREQLRALVASCFDACLVGEADLAEELPPWLERWGYPGSAHDFLDAIFAAQREPEEPLLARVDALRGEGLCCGIASNQERWRAEHLERSLRLARRFDRLFFSCRLGARKPEPRFYREVERQLGVAGEDILFWDDQPENVAAARERGWSAELYTGAEGFEAELARYRPAGPS